MLLCPRPAPAQVDQAITRAQSNNIQRAIENQLSAIIYPRLTVRNPIRAHVTAISAAPVRDELLVLLDDGTARLWDTSRGIEERVVTLPGDRLRSAAWAPEHSQILFGTERGKVAAWNVWSDNWAPLDLDAGGPVVQVQVSPDGAHGVAASATGRLFRIDFTPAPKVMPIGDAGEALRGLDLSSDGSLVFALGNSGQLHMWSQATRAFTNPVPNLSLTAVAAFKTNGFVTADAQGWVNLWQPGPSGAFAGHPLGTQHKGAVTALLPLPGRQIVVSAGVDKVIQIAPLTDLGPKLVTVTMDAVPHCLAADRTGRRLYACNETGLTDLLDLQSGARLGQLMETATGWAVVDSTGRFDGSFGGLNDVEFIASSAHFSVDHFAQGYYEPGLLTEIMDPAGRPATAGAVPLARGLPSPPVARIEVQGKPTATQVELQVTATVARGQVRAIRLERGGRALNMQDAATVAVEKDASTSIGTGTRRTVLYKLPLLPGRNDFAAVAIGDSPIEGEPATAQVVAPAGAAGPRTLRVLSVGINSYVLPQLHLGFAAADARSIVDTIRTRQPSDISSVSVQTLFDGAATAAAINQALTQLEAASPDDVVVIYLAGHGTVAQGQWYFLPADLPAVSLDAVQRYGISVDKLQSYLSHVGALRVAIIIDACYSGSAVESISRSIAHRNLYAIGHSLGIDVLAAAEKDNEAPEFPALGHGALTYTLLQGLNGAAASGGVDIFVRNLMAYAQSATPQIARIEFEKNQMQRGIGAVNLANAVEGVHLPVPMMVSFGDDFSIARRGR